MSWAAVRAGIRNTQATSATKDRGTISRCWVSVSVTPTAYQALQRQVSLGTVELNERTEMLELIMVDGRARGIV